MAATSPRAPTGVVITVQRYWSQGDPTDEARISTCRAALKAAGIHVWEARVAPAPGFSSPALPGKIKVA